MLITIEKHNALMAQQAKDELALVKKYQEVEQERNLLKQELEMILQFSSDQLIEYTAKKYVEDHCELQDF